MTGRDIVGCHPRPDELVGRARQVARFRHRQAYGVCRSLLVAPWLPVANERGRWLRRIAGRPSGRVAVT